MSLDEDAIQIIIDAKTDEAQKAKKALENLGNQVKSLKSDLDAGRIGQGQFESGFAKLDTQISRTRAGLKGIEQDILNVGNKLQGGARSSAKFQVGLAGANIIQDVAQGGPSAGINNILGLAGSTGVRALTSEFVAAAGGAKVLAGTIGAIGAAATTAFVIVDQGLASNKLGWSDLGSVIDEISGNAFSATAKVWGETLGEVRDSLGGMIGSIAEATIGWTTSAEAVRHHKDEIDRNTKALEDYEAAAKKIAGVKSDAQVEAEKAGGQFGKEAAALGGKGSLKAVIDDLARAQAGANADREEEVEVNELDKDGTPTGKTKKIKKTGQQLAAEGITRDFAKAIGGDEGAQATLRKRLVDIGKDASNLGHQEEDDRKFAENDDLDIEREDELRKRDKQARAARRKKTQEVDEAVQDVQDGIEAQESRDRQDKLSGKTAKEALDKAEKATSGTGLDRRAEDATIRQIFAGGSKEQILNRITDQFAREFERAGLGPDEARDAARLKAEGTFAKVGDEAVDAAMSPDKRREAEKLRDVQRIGVADFARSVEGAGAGDSKKIAENTSAMKDQLVELVRQGKAPAIVG